MPARPQSTQHGLLQCKQARARLLESVHAFGQVGLRSSQKDVEVIIEQSVSEDSPAALSGMAIEQAEPFLPVTVVSNDVAAFQTTLGDVINTVGDVESRLARHGVPGL